MFESTFNLQTLLFTFCKFSSQTCLVLLIRLALATLCSSVSFFPFCIWTQRTPKTICWQCIANIKLPFVVNSYFIGWCNFFTLRLSNNFNDRSVPVGLHVSYRQRLHPIVCALSLSVFSVLIVVDAVVLIYQTDSFAIILALFCVLFSFIHSLACSQSVLMLSFRAAANCRHCCWQ